jgi:hypothetical protein
MLNVREPRALLRALRRHQRKRLIRRTYKFDNEELRLRIGHALAARFRHAYDLRMLFEIGENAPVFSLLATLSHRACKTAGIVIQRYDFTRFSSLSSFVSRLATFVQRFSEQGKRTLYFKVDTRLGRIWCAAANKPVLDALFAARRITVKFAYKAHRRRPDVEALYK